MTAVVACVVVVFIVLRVVGAGPVDVVRADVVFVVLDVVVVAAVNVVGAAVLCFTEKSLCWELWVTVRLQLSDGRLLFCSGPGSG